MWFWIIAGLVALTVVTVSWLRAGRSRPALHADDTNTTTNLAIVEAQAKSAAMQSWI